MAPMQPLFAAGRRDSSIRSEERAADEDTALLGSERIAPSAPRSNNTFWRELGLFTWAMVATAGVIVLAVLSQHQAAQHDKKPTTTGKRNLIFMVSDGMGPASLSMTRSFRQLTGKSHFYNFYIYANSVENLPHTDVLVLDQHFIGSSRTRSSSSLVTDSAAGATAFSCGLKSYNGAISILPDHKPCGTILEAAKRAGYMTGLVVTTSLTDATPACFAAHANLRTEEDLIAQQEIGEHPLGRGKPFPAILLQYMADHFP
jgi:alkaline phosphatase